MVPLTSLWLPIFVSALAVFLVSSVMHAVMTYHQSDYRQAPSEDELLALLRRVAIPAGEYELPHPATAKIRASPEFQAKARQGVNAILTVVDGPPNMGKLLGQWFGYSVVVGLLAAYLAGRALPAGATYLAVFRLVGCAAFLGYAVALWQNSIWAGKPWGTTLKNTLDGAVYAGVTAGVFGWLWPS